VRGEGILSAIDGDFELAIDDVEVVNTGYYGIGSQRGRLKSGLLCNLHFRDIGGDCIDIKTHTAPDPAKQQILEQLFAYDGCGHNYLGGPRVSQHENQACFDLGGPSIVRPARKLVTLASEPALLVPPSLERGLAFRTFLISTSSPANSRVKGRQD